MKLCELNSFHRNTEKKKQEVTSKMVYLEVQKWRECILHVEYRKYRKKRKHECRWECNFVGPHLVSYTNFGQPRTRIKEALCVFYFTAEFFDDLGRIFLYFMFIFPDRPPFPFVLLSRLVLEFSPIGIVSACFWALSRYQKTVNSPQHRRGMGGKPTGFMSCLPKGFFSNPSSSFTHCIYTISFYRVLSRAFMERMSFFW